MRHSLFILLFFINGISFCQNTDILFSNDGKYVLERERSWNHEDTLCAKYLFHDKEILDAKNNTTGPTSPLELLFLNDSVYFVKMAHHKDEDKGIPDPSPIIYILDTCSNIFYQIDSVINRADFYPRYNLNVNSEYLEDTFTLSIDTLSIKLIREGDGSPDCDSVFMYNVLLTGHYKNHKYFEERIEFTGFNLQDFLSSFHVFKSNIYGYYFLRSYLNPTIYDADPCIDGSMSPIFRIAVSPKSLYKIGRF